MDELLTGNYYHIYNHAVASDNLFLNDDHYSYFLKKYLHYINPIAETFAYCLMPNHFHLAIKIKEEEKIKELTGWNDLSGKISQQFSNLFNSYSKSFNKAQNRSGSLFRRPFRRKQIDNDNYFKQLIHYIHYNPVHHGFVSDLRDWKHSSYESFFSDKASKIERQQVIEWFIDKESFYKFHQQEVDNKLALDLKFD